MSVHGSRQTLCWLLQPSFLNSSSCLAHTPLNGRCLCVCLYLSSELTVRYNSWQNLLDYVHPKSLYLSWWLIRMSLAHQGVCVCVRAPWGMWIIAPCLCVYVRALAFKPLAFNALDTITAETISQSSPPRHLSSLFLSLSFLPLCSHLVVFLSITSRNLISLYHGCIALV